MQYYTFAAIDVGSHEVSMKIYEISKERGLKVLDYVHHANLLGLETYSTGRISYSSIDKLCRYLNKFRDKMGEYGVLDYSIVSTSAVREARNNIIFLDQVKQKTGFSIKILSNSEQRFLCYKAIALNQNAFHKLIKKGTLLVDVGGGSMQLSLFDKEKLITTQNIKLGSLRIQEELDDIKENANSYQELIYEYIYNDLHTFSQLFLGNYEIKSIIAIGNQLGSFIKYLSSHNFGNVIPSDAKGRKRDSVNRTEYAQFFETIASEKPEELSKELETSVEQASLLLPTAMIYKLVFEETGAENMWLSDISICDGMAADFAEKKVGIEPAHHFRNDIIKTAEQVAIRYNCDMDSNKNVLANGLRIFDFLKGTHSLSDRHRLLLQITILLYRCGSFVNINEVGENSYKIVMSTEIIGLSHKERMMIAYAIRYVDSKFPSYGELMDSLNQEEYILLSKLNAILRLADAMDSSHTQKFEEVKIEIVDEKMYVFGNTLKDITLERGRFAERADFFEEVFGIRPELRRKRF